MSWAGSTHPQNSVAKDCLPSSTLWIQDCEPLSRGSTIRTIFLIVCSSRNMSQSGHGHPRKLNFENFPALWIKGCYHLSHDSKMHIIFLGLRFNNNMSGAGSVHPRKLNYDKERTLAVVYAVS